MEAMKLASQQQIHNSKDFNVDGTPWSILKLFQSLVS